jgi:polysaccharide biosynthesis transport protein
MNFQQFLNILWSRKWLALSVFILTVATTVGITLLLPKEYKATTSLVIDHRGVDPITGMTLPSQLLPGYMATQAVIIASHNVALKVVSALKLTENPQLQTDFQKAEVPGNINDWVADLLLEKLDIEPSKESNVIEVSFSGVDPQFSAAVANIFAQSYIQTNVELLTQPAKHSNSWFNEQLTYFRNNLETAQKKLSSYQQKYGIVDDERLNLENNRLADLSRQLSESEVRTFELLSRKKQFEKGTGSENAFESMEEVLSNSLVQGLKGDLARAEAKFADLATRVDKNHPQYIQTKAEIASLSNKIQAEMNTVLKSIESNNASSKQRDQSLTQALAEQKSKVLKLKQQKDEIAVLNREVESAQHSYDNALQRSVQTRMESEVNQTNIAILNPAIPPATPDKPKKLLNIALSIFLGGLLGIGTALFAELMDRKVRSPLDIVETLALPVLGVTVAQSKPAKLRNIFKKKQSLVQPTVQGAYFD